MRVGAVSGDLVVKLALAIAGIGLAVWVARKAASAAPGAISAAVDAINPASPSNVAYTAASGAVSTLAGREETLGTWLAGLTGADRDAEVRAMLNGAPPTTHDAAIQYGMGDMLGIGA